MPDIPIKNLSEDVVDKLKIRAAHNHRSLQEEFKYVLTAAARETQHKVFSPIESELYMSDAEDVGPWRREDAYDDDGR